MTVWGFLKEKWVYLALTAASTGMVLLILSALSSGAGLLVFTAMLLAVPVLTGLCVEYLKKKRFYGRLLEKLDNLDKEYLVGELLEEPDFEEGEILCEVLRRAGKSMNDEIAHYRALSIDYREYIDTWVHEVKTPIASGRLLAENNPGEVSRAFAAEFSKIERYVEQALYYSKSNSVEKDYIIKKTSLESLVKSTVRKNAALFIESHVRLELHALDYEIYTDVKWVEFILGQVFSNAVKYASKEDPVVHVEAEERSNSIALKITDNGIGIGEKDIERVFEKGFTGENGRQYARSTGIGLYLCRKLCDKLGLSISIASEPGAWTQVRIVFPKGRMQLLI